MDSQNFTAQESTLAVALELAKQRLQQFAADPEFLAKMQIAFGDAIDLTAAGAVGENWLNGDYAIVPPVEIRPAAEINGANGGYAGATNTIYISAEFLGQNAANPEEVRRVLLEEIGHAVDWQLNEYDTPGDEGAIFSALAGGAALSEEQLAQLRGEDDTAVVSLDGESLQLQQDDPPAPMTLDVIWANSIGGGSGQRGNGIAVDGSGNVYATGYFNDTIDIDGDGTVDLSVEARSAYIVQFNSDGTLAWANSIEGTTNTQGNGIAVDGSGNVYATGYFYGIIDIDGDGTDDLINVAYLEEDAYIVKFNGDGTLAWSTSIGEPYGGQDWGQDIVMDDSGNVYATGSFSGSIDIDGDGTADLTSTGYMDTYIAQFNSDGILAWAKGFGGSDFDHGYDIAVDGSGNIYVTGNFASSSTSATPPAPPSPTPKASSPSKTTIPNPPPSPSTPTTTPPCKHSTTAPTGKIGRTIPVGTLATRLLTLP